MKFKKLLVVGTLAMMTLSLQGCIKPYKKPILETAEPSETMIVIDLDGGGDNQAIFSSEKLLEESKVATTQIEVKQRWLQTGRFSWSGEWIPAQKVIKVSRKPVSREWSKEANSGTSKKDQAIYAESKESIGFNVPMNMTAKIEEKNVALFLYSYAGSSLETILDTEIRPAVEGEWNDIVSTSYMEDIQDNKAKLFEDLREKIVKKYEEFGITITTFGLKEGISYEDDDIQKAINAKIISAQKLVTEQNNSKVKIEQAEADAKVKITEAEATAKANKLESDSLTDKLIEIRRIEKWNGSKATTVVGSGSSAIVDTTK